MNMSISWLRRLGMSLFVGGVFISGSAWGAEKTLYQEVLDKIEQLTPQGHIQLDMAVEPRRYAEKYCVTDASLAELRQNGMPASLLDNLTPIKDRSFGTQTAFLQAIEPLLGSTAYSDAILKAARYTNNEVAYQFGEQFELRFQASESCYVALMHIAELKTDRNMKALSGGAITLLLPNQAFRETRINAGQVYSTVQDFHLNLPIAGPATIEVVNLFCSQTPLNWIDSAQGADPYYVIKPMDDARLRHLLGILEQLEQSEWIGDSLILRLGSVNERAIRKFGAIPPISASGTTGKESTRGDERIDEGSSRKVRLQKLWNVSSN